MTQLGLSEFLAACEIPSGQRNYTGSDRGTILSLVPSLYLRWSSYTRSSFASSPKRYSFSLRLRVTHWLGRFVSVCFPLVAWTTLVNREQVQSMLKVVQDFVIGLRVHQNVPPMAGDQTAIGVTPSSVVTPAGKMFKPTLDSNQGKNQVQAKNAAKEQATVDTERNTDSSINTSPVLLPKGHGGTRGLQDAEGTKQDDERNQNERDEREQKPRNELRGDREDREGNVQVVLRKGPSSLPVSNLAGRSRGVQVQTGDRPKSSSQMAANELSMSNTQEVDMETTSPGVKKKRGLVKNGEFGTMGAGVGAGAVAVPSSTRKEIQNARARLASASVRRKSLEPPIGSEEADRMAGLRTNLERRKRPHANNDGILGARQYLGSVDNGGESAGASIGSAAGNNHVMHIGRSRLGVSTDRVGRAERVDLDRSDRNADSRKQKKYAGGDGNESVFDFDMLPAHLQKSLDLIKQRKLEASAAKKKKKTSIDLTGLQRMNYDPRRLMQ